MFSKKFLSTRAGLTMIELLVASIFATFLMTSILGVLQSVAKRQKQLTSRIKLEPWKNRFTERLEWDLRNSHSLRVIPEGVELEGFASRDHATYRALHLPTTVRYQIETYKDQSWLVRSERRAAIGIDARPPKTLVCHANRLVVSGIEGGGSTADPSIASAGLKELSNGVIPPRLSVTIYDQLGSPMFQHDFILH